MPKTYAQLQKQIEALQREADKAREAEVLGVIERIKVAISHYELTSDQLFGNAKGKRGAIAQAGAAPKYSDGMGNSWSGKGKRPNWLRDALSSGRSLEEFAAASSGQSRQAPAQKKAKRSTKVAFRDSAGNAWSGMGPRPKWLKDAIAAGQSEESLRI